MSNFINYQNVIDQMRAYGLMVNHMDVGNSNPKRVKVDPAKCPVDKEKVKSAGWYRLHAFSIDGKDYIVGSFGYWKGADNNAQKVEWKKEWSDNITPEQRQAMADAHKAAIKQEEDRRQKEIAICANKATKAWYQYKTEGTSGYLARKQVGAHGVRFYPYNRDTIAVPLMDVKGKIFGLQLIRGDAGSHLQKTFFPRGCEKKAHFHVIGNLANAEVVFIAEGYATAASIHEATGDVVVVAFDAGNLTPVAKVIRKAYPTLDIVVCADDDYLSEGNPGVTHAQNAALSVSGKMIKPDFVVAGVDIRNGQKLTDFNDLHLLEGGGLHLVSEQLSVFKVKRETLPAVQAVGAVAITGEGERKQAVSVMSVDEIVERFTYIDDDSGDYCFDNWERRVVRTKKAQTLLPNGVRWDRVKEHPLWQSKAVYRDQVGFDPTGKDTNIKLNRWRGFPTVPANHDDPLPHCEKLLSLLFELCSNAFNKPLEGEKDVYKWVIQWLAYPIKNPGAKMDTALIIHGSQGTGKNLFFNAYGSIYDGASEYRKHFSLITQDTMEDQFNSDWVDQKLFVLADEIVAVQERTHVKNKLKTMVTGVKIRINQKMVAAYSEKNYYNMVFLSNEMNPVVLERDDRRYFVIWTPPAREESFYTEVAKEIERGGVSALHQFLLNVDVSDFDPNGRPPMTKAKQDLVFLNLDSPNAFYYEWQNGYLDIPFKPCPTTMLYAFYRQWCHRQGEKFPKIQRQLAASLGTIGAMHKEENCYKNKNDNKNGRVYFVQPPLSDYKKAYEAGVDCDHPDSSNNVDKTRRNVFTEFYAEFNKLSGELL